MKEFDISYEPEPVNRPVTAKLCINCANSRWKSRMDSNPICLAFIDLITGDGVGMFCREARNQHLAPNVGRPVYPANNSLLLTAGCGPEGLMFVPKPEDKPKELVEKLRDAAKNSKK